MATTPTDGGTPVDTVPAFVVTFGGGASGIGPGRIDVTNVVGKCVLTIGRTWVVLDRDQLGLLWTALAVADHDLGHQPPTPGPLTAADEHAKRLIESLDLQWPPQ